MDLLAGLTLSADWVAAACAAIAAAVAAAELHASRRGEKRQATFAHLLQISNLLASVRHAEPERLKADVIAYYRGEVKSLSEASQSYLALLDALDLLALACELGTVEEKVVTRYLRGLLVNPYLFTEHFADALRSATNDKHIYEHLLSLTSSVRSISP